MGTPQASEWPGVGGLRVGGAPPMNDTPPHSLFPNAQSEKQTNKQKEKCHTICFLVAIKQIDYDGGFSPGLGMSTFRLLY